MSNQGGISLSDGQKSFKGNTKSLTNFKTKANAVFSVLDIPITLFAATGKDIYRKPRQGMWTEMLSLLDADTLMSLDLSESIFVGDAGGRIKTMKSAKDFSCSDR